MTALPESFNGFRPFGLSKSAKTTFHVDESFMDFKLFFIINFSFLIFTGKRHNLIGSPFLFLRKSPLPDLLCDIIFIIALTIIKISFVNLSKRLYQFVVFIKTYFKIAIITRHGLKLKFVYITGQSEFTYLNKSRVADFSELFIVNTLWCNKQLK